MPRKVGNSLKANNRMSPEDRFWVQVNKDGPEHPTLGKCWLWTGSMPSGYGYIRFCSRLHRVNRYSWILHFGSIPDNLCVCHHCDNTACVNPAHLFLGSHTDNMHDMQNKGRNATLRGELRGVRNGRALLSVEQVETIRKRYRRGCSVNGCEALGREFGVAPSTIRSVVKRVNWKRME